MVKKNTVFDYFTQLMVIWGVSMLSLYGFCVLCGERGRGYSSIFELGSAGIPVSTAMQFLGLAGIITGLKWLFFTDTVIKRLGIMGRVIMMFVCVVLSVGVFAAVFEWFPVNQVKPWLLFFICFLICAAVSVLVSVRKEKSDNRKMQEALERLKGEKFDESGNQRTGSES